MTKKEMKKGRAKEWYATLEEYLIETTSRNWVLLSTISAVFVVLTGAVLLTNPSQVWKPITLLIVALGAYYSFYNAPGILKGLLSFILLVAISSMTTSAAILYDPYSNNHLLVMVAFYFSFFMWLFVTYLKPRPKSRWGSLNAGLLTAGFASYVAGFTTLSGVVAAITAVVTFSLIFALNYFLSAQGRLNRDSMPINVIDEQSWNGLKEEAEYRNFTLSRNSKKGSERILAFNNRRAFMLIPVYMDQPFKMDIFSKKRNGMTYNGKRIAPYLVDIIYNARPKGKTKGADILPVLLDLKDANGGIPRVIKVALPNTKKFGIVAIVPAKYLRESKTSNGIPNVLYYLEEELGEHVDKLDVSQKEALAKISSKFEQVEEADYL